jgi:hypothetical protein
MIPGLKIETWGTGLRPSELYIYREGAKYARIHGKS